MWTVNTELGFPGALDALNFRIMVLHYSLFGWRPFYLSDPFRRYLDDPARVTRSPFSRTNTATGPSVRSS